MSAPMFLAAFLGCLFAIAFVAIGVFGYLKWKTRRFLAQNSEEIARQTMGNLSDEEQQGLERFAHEVLRRAPSPHVSISMTTDQSALLKRWLTIGFGELQARVNRGDEDDQLTELIAMFDVYFAMLRDRLGHDRAPISTWETYEWETYEMICNRASTNASASANAHPSAEPPP